MQGAGKYDEQATRARESAQADGVVLFVFGGSKGHGWSVQCTPELSARLPELLELLARHIREEVAAIAREEAANAPKRV
jgi:UDP-N-acetylglucosamine:LPS N-acetylglucosamine transferase